MSEPRFATLLGYLLSGMILWAAAFTAAYAGAAFICARRLGDTTVLGIAVLSFWIGVMTLAALTATLIIALVAYRRRSQRGDFMHGLTLLLALLAMIGIAWNGVPALMFTTCA